MNIPQVNQLKSKGIKVIDPQTTYIDQSVKITGKSITIHPNTFITGSTEIKDECEIGPNSFLSNAKIEKNVKITFSHIEDSHIEKNCIIGPYSRIRNNSKIGKNVSIGNFAEIKSSNVKSFLKTIIHEIFHAMDAKKYGVKGFKEKYEMEIAQWQAENPNKNPDNWYKHIRSEVEAEKFGQKNYSKWLSKFKKDGYID